MEQHTLSDMMRKAMKTFMAMKILTVIVPVFAQDPLAIERIDASTPREVQIALAESAAPPEIAKHATIMVLGKKGYEIARKGDNGFTCLIDRDRLEEVAPECFDAEGSATTLKARMFIEEQRAKGVADETIRKQIADGYKSGRFNAPSKPGIVYMLSKYNCVYDPERGKIISFPGHLMFYAPYATEKSVGTGPGAPYILSPGKPDAVLVVVPETH